MSKRKTLTLARDRVALPHPHYSAWTPSRGERVTTHSCCHATQHLDKHVGRQPIQSPRFHAAPHAHQRRCQRLQTMSDRTCIIHTKTVTRLSITRTLVSEAHLVVARCQRYLPLHRPTTANGFGQRARHGYLFCLLYGCCTWSWSVRRGCDRQRRQLDGVQSSTRLQTSMR